MPQCPRCAAEAAPGYRFCGSCGTAFPTATSTVLLPHGVAARLSPTSTPDEGRFPPGTILSQRYRIGGRLGHGGMGEVYRATDMLLGQAVALKFLPERLANNDSALDRLRSEVRVTRQISHPNVCRVYDLGEADGQVFLTMEFIDGEDLASLLRRIGRLPSVKALEFARRLCAGLAAAHEKNVLHRDLKPSNIMVNGRGQVLITDFGLAAIAPDIAPADVYSGTPAYMSPEQLAGIEVTVRSDLYSLGLVLYELFSGAPPYEAATREEFLRRRRGPPPSLVDSVPDIDPAVDRVVARCLAPDPASRPQSAMAVAAALPGGDPLAAALAMGETPSPDLVAAAEPSETMRPRVALACFGGLALLLVVAAWLFGSTSVFAPAAHINPAVMAQSAADLLSGWGYVAPGSSSDWGYAPDPQRLDQLQKLDVRTVRRLVAEDPPAYFWYRSSPRPMLATMNPYQPFVTESDPPLTTPGMVLVHLDTTRRLRLLKAVPPEREPAKLDATSAFDWARTFSAAGLEPSRFAAATPLWTPPSAFNARGAWVEQGGTDPLRVEAAAWRGQPVFFRVERRSAVVADTPPQSSGSAFFVYNVLVTAIIAVLVWLNVRKRRGDLRGAGRFGLAIAIAVFAYQLICANHTTHREEWLSFIAGWGNALWAGTYSGLAYLAFEPYIRRKWPHMLISWTRLLAGRYRDPLVGQHVLLGLLFGAAVECAVGLLSRYGYGFSVPFWYPVSSSPVHLAGAVITSIPGVAIDTAALVCLLLFTATVFRIAWIGAVVTAVIGTAVITVAAPHALLTSVVVLALYTGAMLVTLRFGVVALGGIAFVHHFENFPLTLDRSAFYFGPSLTVMAVILGLGAYACRTAIAGRLLR